MPHLTQHQRQNLREQLQVRERDLHAGLRREQHKDEEHRLIAGEARDSGDHSAAIELHDVSRAEIGRGARALGDIADTLRRISGADYGVCVACGDAIPYARLRAQPTAVRCSRCQTAFERSYAGSGRGPTM